MSRVLVVSLSAPELDRLAVELAARDALLAIVRRYANTGRPVERWLERAPLVRSGYAGTFGRRRPPPGLRAEHIQAAGLAPDFTAAVVNRLGRGAPDLVTPLTRYMLAATERGVANAARRLVPGADVVVASYHVAAPAFERARALGRRTILNYPIAHHRWQYRYYAEQAARNPEYAAALPDFGDVEAHAAALDREIELADLILVGSSFVRDTFVAEGVPSEKIRVVPYGADLQRFVPGSGRTRDGLFRIAFVGQIGERKGVSHLLRAYESFRKDDTELHLVGDFVKGGDVYGRHQGLYRHTAHVPQEQLRGLLQQAHVFVLPSLVEGMPLVVLEAMACGLPVIVTPHGASDIVRDGVDGFLVPPCSVDAIRDRLARLYDDRELAARMGANARRRAEEWTWARYASAASEVVLAAAMAKSGGRGHPPRMPLDEAGACESH